MEVPNRLKPENLGFIDQELEVIGQSTINNVKHCYSLRKKREKLTADSVNISIYDAHAARSLIEKSPLTYGQKGFTDALLYQFGKGYHGARAIGPGWWFEPFSLSMKEERLVGKRRHWFRLPNTRHGSYLVAPDRYDIQWIQRIYWTSQEIRRVTRLASCSPSKDLIKDLKVIRNQIYSLSPGNGERSLLMAKLFSDVHYCLRQCSRL
jgi:hypothetical protein